MNKTLLLLLAASAFTVTACGQKRGEEPAASPAAAVVQTDRDKGTDTVTTEDTRGKGTDTVTTEDTRSKGTDTVVEEDTRGKGTDTVTSETAK